MNAEQRGTELKGGSIPTDAESVRGLMKDAERYRKIRRFHPGEFHAVFLRSMGNTDTFDAVIDSGISPAVWQEPSVGTTGIGPAEG